MKVCNSGLEVANSWRNVGNFSARVGNFSAEVVTSGQKPGTFSLFFGSLPGSCVAVTKVVTLSPSPAINGNLYLK